MEPSSTPLGTHIAVRFPHISPEERQRLEDDFSCYRQELSRLLAEGHADRWVLIKDGQVVSVWDTYGDARQNGLEKFNDRPFSVNRVNPLDVARFPLFDAKIKNSSGAACPS